MTSPTQPQQPQHRSTSTPPTSTSARPSGAAYGIPLAIDLSGGPNRRYLAHGEWRQSATCRSNDVEWWFAKPTSARSRAAVQICQECPVRRECLAAGLLYDEEFGLWGGVNHLQRRPLVARLLGGEPLGSVLASTLETGSETNRTEVA